MKRILTTFLMLVAVFAAQAQSDYRIQDARTVKANYKAFPWDIETQELAWASVLSECIDDAHFGNWFELKVRNDRFRFTVLTGERMGNIKNPTLYIGEVIETQVSRELKEIKCISHTGDNGAFTIEVTDLDPSKRYFLLLVADKAGYRYAIETTDDFNTMVMVPQKQKEPVYSIFGRILDKAGKPRGGVDVTLLDANEKYVRATRTDETGTFTFEALPKQDVFMTRIEEDDTEMLVEMFLVDDKGSIKSRATRIGEQLYAFGANLNGFRQLNLLTPREFALNTEEGKIGVVGRIVDNQTFLFGRSNVKVGLYSKSKDLVASSETNDDGMFRFDNLDMDEYAVQVEGDNEKANFVEIVMVDDMDVPFSYSNSTMLGKNGFFSFEKLPTEEVELMRMEVQDTKLAEEDEFENLEKGSQMVLNHILFETGSSTLLEESYIELDALTRGLTHNPELKIEVTGYTDNVGSAAVNQKLSKARAKAVVDYLISKGIEEQRLSYKGLGQASPIASNDTAEGRKRNRRVEFRVLD